jgi:hypothetical protein
LGCCWRHHSVCGSSSFGASSRFSPQVCCQIRGWLHIPLSLPQLGQDAVVPVSDDYGPEVPFQVLLLPLISCSWMFFNMEEDWVLGTSETPGVEGGGDYEFCQKNGFYGSRSPSLSSFTSPESGTASSPLLGQRLAATRLRIFFSVGTGVSCYKTTDRAQLLLGAGWLPLI